MHCFSAVAELVVQLYDDDTGYVAFADVLEKSQQKEVGII